MCFECSERESVENLIEYPAIAVFGLEINARNSNETKKERPHKRNTQSIEDWQSKLL